MSKHVFSQEQREKWINFIQSLNPDINPGGIQLMQEMRMVSHALYQIREHSVNRANLPYAKYSILMGLMFSAELEGRDELNPSEISQHQGTSRNTVSALIRDLEEDGLIERHLDVKDRRKFNIRLTEAGRSLVYNHARHHFRIIGDCFNVLTAEEQEMLRQLLTKIIAGAEAVQKQMSDSNETVPFQ